MEVGWQSARHCLGSCHHHPAPETLQQMAYAGADEDETSILAWRWACRSAASPPGPFCAEDLDAEVTWRPGSFCNNIFKRSCALSLQGTCCTFLLRTWDLRSKCTSWAYAGLAPSVEFFFPAQFCFLECQLVPCTRAGNPRKQVSRWSAHQELPFYDDTQSPSRSSKRQRPGIIAWTSCEAMFIQMVRWCSFWLPFPCFTNLWRCFRPM
jgi:hypothetical protein